MSDVGKQLLADAIMELQVTRFYVFKLSCSNEQDKKIYDLLVKTVHQLGEEYKRIVTENVDKSKPI